MICDPTAVTSEIVVCPNGQRRLVGRPKRSTKKPARNSRLTNCAHSMAAVMPSIPKREHAGMPTPNKRAAPSKFEKTPGRG